MLSPFRQNDEVLFMRAKATFFFFSFLSSICKYRSGSWYFFFIQFSRSSRLTCEFLNVHTNHTLVPVQNALGKNFKVWKMKKIDFASKFDRKWFFKKHFLRNHISHTYCFLYYTLCSLVFTDSKKNDFCVLLKFATKNE